MIRWARLSLFFCVVSLSAKAESPRELAPGLPYLRVTDLTKDAAEVQTALKNESVVLDLRSAGATAEAAAALAQRLDQPRPSGGHGIRLFLINPSSSAELVQAVSRPRPRSLTIGPRTPALNPDIAVATSVEDDRHAYNALASGTPLEKLIASNPDKKRFDEAALAKTRATAAAADREADDTDASEPDAAPHPTPEKKDSPLPPPAVPHDLVLERAAQIYRALGAAKR